jgi:hypothetical protein
MRDLRERADFNARCRLEGEPLLFSHYLRSLSLSLSRARAPALGWFLGNYGGYPWIQLPAPRARAARQKACIAALELPQWLTSRDRVLYIGLPVISRNKRLEMSEGLLLLLFPFPPPLIPRSPCLTRF